MCEIKTWKRSGKKADNAICLCEYLEKLPEDKMYGIIRKRGTLSIVELGEEKKELVKREL